MQVSRGVIDLVSRLNGEQGRIPAEVSLDGDIVSNVEFLGVSKAGNLSWSGWLGRQRVKIYQTFSHDQASFIQQVSEHPSLGSYLPRVFYRRNEYLVVEWVEGKTLDLREIRRHPSWIEQIAELQVTLHHQRITVEQVGFDYLSFLENRLLRYLGPIEPTDAIQSMLQIVRDWRPSGQCNLCHPDITPSNLVIQTARRRLRLIDNELLTQSAYYPIDLFNTHKSLGPRLGSDLLEPYLVHYVENGGDLTLLAEHEQFFCSLWHLRLIGSSLQNGAIGEAFQLAQQYYVEGHAEAHPLVQLVKERFVQ
jgi:serine/threonine protein kinase